MGLSALFKSGRSLKRWEENDMKKKLVGIALCAVLMLNAAACGTNETPDVVKIGFAGTLSGENALVGQYQKNAIKVVENELAENDGCIEIMGKPVKVEIVLEDTEAKADTCTNVYRKFIDDYDCTAIVGPNESSSALAACPVAQEAEVPTVAVFATNEEVINVGDYIFRACYVDDFQGKVAASFAISELKAKTAAVLFSNADAYSKYLKDAFVEEFEAKGGEVVAIEQYAGADVKDFNAQLINIAAKKPEVLFLPNQVGELPLQIQQARQMGITASFLGGDSWDLNTLVEVAGEDMVEGAYYVAPFSSSDSSEAAQSWVEAYNEVAGENPGSHATLAYEALHIVLDALTKIETFEGSALRDALFETDMVLPSGRVTMDENGDPEKGAVILQYQGGVGEYVTTIAAEQKE